MSIHNLPIYPLLPANTDSRRLEEIRRTVVAINLDPSVIKYPFFIYDVIFLSNSLILILKLSAKKVVQFFSSAGEVKYFRFCSKENDDTRYAMIEFVEQESVVPALKLNNKQLGENIIKYKACRLRRFTFLADRFLHPGFIIQPRPLSSRYRRTSRMKPLKKRLKKLSTASRKPNSQF